MEKKKEGILNKLGIHVSQTSSTFFKKNEEKNLLAFPRERSEWTVA